MRLSTIDMLLVKAIEHHADFCIADNALLDHVVAECPSASLRDISRAALYAATDATRQNVQITVRLYNFALNIRTLA
jgi:hypothetical protein